LNKKYIRRNELLKLLNRKIDQQRKWLKDLDLEAPIEAPIGERKKKIGNCRFREKLRKKN